MKSVTASCIVCAFLGLLASDASAQLFGGDDTKWERILLEIKKLNTRIVEKVIPQIDRINSDIKKIKIEISRVKTEVRNVRSGNNNLSEQIETLSNMIPGIQSSMEQSQVRTMQQIQALGKRLEQLEAKIKAEQAQQARNQQVQLDAIKQEVATQLGSLKDGMAKDMEQIAKLNQSAFQELIKSNAKHLRNQNARVDKSIAIMTEMAKGGANTSEALAVLQAGLVENSKARSEQNKKIIDILSKSLKEQQAAAIEIDALGGNQAKSDENVRYARETMVALKGILDKRLAEIDKTLQAQNDQTMQDADLIKQNLQITDQKINKLAEGLQAIHNQGIDTTKSMLTNASEVNQKIDENRAEVKLTSEKITKLIEILKAIAKKQGKLEQLLASQGGKGGNKQLMNALADLKRKANVNISRNDRILKKLKGSR
ncbi:MAG: hypothetical protein IIA63_06120 [Nitrospinae bacterium]|nr:hypothetical protein [Nitrospinota bacterium]